MNQRRKITLWVGAGLAGALLGTGISGCGGGGGSGIGSGGGSGGGASRPPATGSYIVTNLVSDGALAAAHTDARLKNAWGLAFNPSGFVWVANQGSDTSTLYDGNGVPQSLVVAVPGGPTGIVFNASQDFKVSAAGVNGASAFIFATEDGALAGWSPAVNRTAAITAVDGGTSGPRYTGLAIARVVNENFLLAVDFRNKVVEVYDANFTRLNMPGAFIHPALPDNYAPFGIQAVGRRIYVSYAQQGGAEPDEVAGPGLGIIAAFETTGEFIHELAAGGVLNAPWGMALAPPNFGRFSGDLLVANFGDGKINAYNLTDGSMDGSLSRADGSPIVIDGLWGLAFGNGQNAQPTNSLFFTAGPAGETQGLYGRIDSQ